MPDDTDDSPEDSAPPDEDRPFIRPGPANAPYYTVYCPTREEYRQSYLCETVCADTNWSDKQARKHREKCPVFQKMLDEDMI
jgi:hypothetical protein